MRTDPLRQGAALLGALLIGFAAGLLYDLLRPPRRAGRGLAAFLADAFFCLTVGAALFLFAMSLGEGRLGIGALASAWTGFLAWQHTLGPLLLPHFAKVFQYLDKLHGNGEKFVKKLRFSKKST